MAFDYSKLAATASRLILRFGRTATLRQVTLSGDEWSPTRATADTEITCVDLEQDLRNRAGELIEAGRRTLLVETSAGVTPQREDKIVIDSQIHEVDRVETLKPGNTVILWKVVLAR